MGLTALERNESYSDKTYMLLKQLIITNQIKPGQALNERELSEQLQVSRTPIRDALKMLEKEGWILISGKNRMVSLLTKKTIKNLIEIRCPIELLAFDLFAKKYKREDRSIFQDICNQMHSLSENIDHTNYYRLMQVDTLFHQQIANITGNEQVINIVAGLGDQIVRTSVLSVKYGRLPVSAYAKNHDHLLDYFLQMDMVQARVALIEHINMWQMHLESIPGLYSQGGDDDIVF
ncbi:MAG: GntR family transcriptional regulator [Candidatus Fimivivens sp.]|nr:GntR family transcriptional regulator [Candidatus Fimivivens sp.]